MLLHNIIPFAHSLLQHALPSGGKAIDGTAGNGHDTLFLAQTVGRHGKIWAFDTQAQALEQTRRRLEEAQTGTNISLIHDGHENLHQYITEPVHAAIFNFGWLPGSDKTQTTHPDTSIAALTAALELLQEGGLLAAVLYPGHETGQHEAQAVEKWAQTLPQQQYAVLRYGFANRRNHPPYLLAFEKLRKK